MKKKLEKERSKVDFGHAREIIHMSKNNAEMVVERFGNGKGTDLRPQDLSKSALARIATEIPVDNIIDGIKELLTATKLFGALQTEIPDWGAREAGIKIWLSNVCGEPVRRQEIFQVSAEAGAGALDKILSTESGRDALMKMMRNAEVKQAVETPAAA